MNSTTPSVIARITSGLGNQLFQYAAGLDIASRTHRRLAVDTSWFDFFQVHQPRRSYRLAALGLEAADQESRRGIWRFFQGLACTNQPRVRDFIQGCFKSARIRFVNEIHPFNSHTELYTPLLADEVVLNGYWQIRDPALVAIPNIRSQIFSRWKFSEGAKMWRDQIANSRATFVHIRRGDYKQFGVPLLRPEYYQKGAAEILRHDPQTKFYIFSEDLEWTGQNITLPGKFAVVDYASPNRDIEDLLLMASCAGGIIANSSFSWWGAALLQASLPVIAPSFWTTLGQPAPSQLFPAQWLRLES